ncbi:unnamed protein product [Protopolystoma xenopodis]|uniref:Uncharacterized protein n=1 Tax=Protopolystoma xenopodis TaxID=117903 RepID=A0A3S5FHG1_9PLAT|nr:unnamed protein product [Protopolystoma xenopodis]
MARLPDDADYDAGETSGIVPRPRYYSGNVDAYNGLRNRMARLPDDADYDAGETSGIVPHPRYYSGNVDAYNGLRNRCVPLSLPIKMTKLRKRGQTTS